MQPAAHRETLIRWRRIGWGIGLPAKDVEYKPSANTSEHVTFSGVLIGSKNEPVITAPADMTIDNSGSDNKLSHGAPGAGLIASVTIKYGSATQTCKPIGGKFTKDITVRPLR
jgi:hypothetical protein